MRQRKNVIRTVDTFWDLVNTLNLQVLLQHIKDKVIEMSKRQSDSSLLRNLTALEKKVWSRCCNQI